MLFELRKYRLPIDFNDKNNMAGVIINNIIKEENIAKQHGPLDSSIFAKIIAIGSQIQQLGLKL
jgi:hypothetical protein